MEFTAPGNYYPLYRRDGSTTERQRQDNNMNSVFS